LYKCVVELEIYVCGHFRYLGHFKAFLKEVLYEKARETLFQFTERNGVPENGSVSLPSLPKPVCHPKFHLRMEANPIPETFCVLEYRTMDQVRKLSNPRFNLKSSKPLELRYTVLGNTSQKVNYSCI
jgi:hypothetical protein